MRELTAPTPHAGAAIPGAALRARECARTEVALPWFRESGTLPPFHRCPDRVPSRVPFPGQYPSPPVLPPNPPSRSSY